MTIVAARPGGWVSGNRLRSAEMNTLQVELLKAIDGSGGGAYTPTAPIEIGGSGVTIVDDLPLKYNSRTISKVIGGNLRLAGDFAWQDHGDGSLWRQTATAGSLLSLAVEMPVRGTLESVQMRLSPSSGHAALPATKPSIFVRRRAITQDTITDSWSEENTYANVAAYEADHWVIATVGESNPGLLYSWTIDVRGELGANSQVGLEILSLIANFSFTEQPEC